MKVYIVYRGGHFDAPVMQCICATEQLARVATEELVQKELKRLASSHLKPKNPEEFAREMYYWDEVDVRTK